MNTIEKIKNNKAKELVRECCEYTAANHPDRASKAAALADAFDKWASDEWIAKTGNGTYSGKEWFAFCSQGYS